MFECVFPGNVVVVAAERSAWKGELHPDEAASLGPCREARRLEFAAGRACAREALARLGLPAGPLPRGADRLPRWPIGATGSISHCPGLCAAAVGRAERYASLGFDLERAERVGPELARRICTEAERAQLGALEEPAALAIVFSCKEAVYKAWHPLTRATLGFHDQEVEIDPVGSAFAARLVNPASAAAAGHREFEGRFALEGGVVAAGLAVERG